MKQSVFDYFLIFNRDMEGVIPHMYVDTKGYVTTAIGFKLMSVEDVVKQSWLTKDDLPANAIEIAAEYRQMLADKESLAQGGAPAAAKVATLHLEPGTIDAMCLGRLRDMEREVAPLLDWSSWPADAQLAVLSICWATGATYFRQNYKRFLWFAQARPPQFYGCARESNLDESKDKNIWKRNARQRVLLRNAAVVLADKMERRDLYYPQQLSDVKEKRLA